MSAVPPPTSPRSPRATSPLRSPRGQQHSAAVRTKHAAQKSMPPRSTSSRIPKLSPRRDSKDEQKTEEAVSPRFRANSSSRQFRSTKRVTVSSPDLHLKDHSRSKSSSRRSQKPPLLRKATPVHLPVRFAYLVKFAGRTPSDSSLLEKSETPSPHSQLQKFSFQKKETPSPELPRADGEAILETMRVLFKGAKEAALGHYRDRYFFQIEKEAEWHQPFLHEWPFFSMFAKSQGVDLPEELTSAEVEGVKQQFKPKDIFQFYQEKLEDFGVLFPEQIKLIFSKNIQISAFEASAQAAYNLAVLMTQIHSDFHKVYRGSTDPIEYFFKLIENPQWLQTTVEINLKGLALTWVPRIFCTLPLVNLQRLILRNTLLQEIRSPFFHGSPEVAFFDVSDTHIRVVDDSFGSSWDKIEEMRFRRTKLTSFPFQNFEDNPKLTLDFQGTPMEEFPEEPACTILK